MISTDQDQDQGVANNIVKNKHGFRSCRVKAKAKLGRGCISDPKVVLEALIDSWTILNDGLNELDSEESDALRSYFNEIIPDDNPEIGDLLFGDTPEDFSTSIEALGDEAKNTLASALIDVQLIDPEYLSESIKL